MFRRRRNERTDGPAAIAPLELSGDEPWNMEMFTPENWFFLRGEPVVDTPALETAVDARIRERPEWAALRDAMLDPMVDLSESLARLTGTMCGAFRWEWTDEALVTATVIVRAYQRPAGPAEAALEAMTEQVSAQEPGDEHPPDIKRVELGIGPAVRREVVLQPAPRSGEPQPLRLTVNYWAPLDFAPNRMVGMTASTASLASAARIVSEFDAMATSLRVGSAPTASRMPDDQGR